VRKYAQTATTFDSPIARPPKRIVADLPIDHDDDDVNDDDTSDTSDEVQPENLKGNRLFGFVKKLFKP
jgi:hypothetical protein